MLLSKALSLKILFILIVLSSGQPIGTGVDDNSVEENVPDTPKWHNHCKPEPSQNLLSPDSNGFELIQEYMQKVEKTALIAMKRADKTKSKFDKFEDIFKNLEYFRFRSEFEWLPKISPVSEEDFKDMTKELALLKAQEYIEKFAVALEQVRDDFRKNRKFIDINTDIESHHFKNIEDDNYNVLCEIRIAMSIVFGSINQQFITRTERSIMPEEDRRIGDQSKRMLRDYLILRQYVKTTHFISKMFEHFRQSYAK